MSKLEPVSTPLLLIVVGAHLDAERHDRLAAYTLQHRIQATLAESGAAIEPLVCTDLWQLNHDGLRAAPTISIGGPAVNALTAFLADKLPSAFAVDGRYVVQMDPELVEPSVACWGETAADTAAAVEAFADRYLDAFLDAARAQRSA